MSLSPGTKLGPYEIVAPIGAGGMGEVYRARDTRLGREVAIKVLPEHLSANPEIRARFEREAKTVSSLNHPNICTLFDVGREGDTDYLVMELIEGETLGARLARGAIAAPELLRIGMQVADALDRAHRAGVIHRDLKPGNIMLTRSGAKLMDFGLARATGLAPVGAPGASAATLPHSPTVGRALTAEGTLLGTFQYMSPEQLEGHEADARSDIWAFGCVLYEMATGRRAFEGRSQASLIAAILEREPAPIPEVPSGTASTAGALPQGLDRLIRNCLAKDPEERSQTAHDVKLQLRGIAETAGYSAASGTYGPATPLPGSTLGAPVPAHAATGRRASPLPWAIAVAALLLAIATAAWLYPTANAPKQVFRFRPDLSVRGSTESFWPRVSPDGQYLAFCSQDSTGGLHGWVRRMDEVTPRPIVGADNLTRLYWSPDSREIAFIANGKMQRVPIAGGAPVVICDAQGGSDLSWGSKGRILMDGSADESLRVVRAAGGELGPATRVDRAHGELGHAWPCFLPDGEHFLYVSYKRRGTNRGSINLGRIGSLESKTLGETDGRVEFAPGGWVLFLHGTTLMAQKLDLAAGKLTGDAIPIAQSVRVGNSDGHFSVSNNGILSYALLQGDAVNSVLLTDRHGNATGAPIATGVFRNPRFSPDGHNVLLERRVADLSVTTGEISVLDLVRSTETKLTFSGGRATTPCWSPDGRRFAWATFGAGGRAALHSGSVDGLGAQDSFVVPNANAAYLCQWDATGSQWNYYVPMNPGVNLYSVPAEGSNRAARPLVDTGSITLGGTVSPDGHWLAFCAGRTPGDLQIYVQSLTGTPGRWQISAAGGYAPKWTRGGRELLYENNARQIMSVDVDSKEGFHAGTPHELLQLPGDFLDLGTTGWDCDATGERFVLIAAARGQAPGAVEVVTDFASLVNRK